MSSNLSGWVNMDYETYKEILKLYESGDGFEFFDLKSEVLLSTIQQRRGFLNEKRTTVTRIQQKKKKTQIEKDIAYCIDTLGLNNGQIGEMFRACEDLGNISVQYL